MSAFTRTTYEAGTHIERCARFPDGTADVDVRVIFESFGEPDSCGCCVMYGSRMDNGTTAAVMFPCDRHKPRFQEAFAMLVNGARERGLQGRPLAELLGEMVAAL